MAPRRTQPRVEVLWWEGCPSTEEAVAEVKEAMAELHLDPDALELRAVRTDEDARRERFVGSPTVLVDGSDVEEPAADEPIGLSCRVYRRPDGTVSTRPDPAAVRRALEASLERIA